MFSFFAQFWVLAYMLHYSEDWDPVSITMIAYLNVVWIFFSKKKLPPFLVSLVWTTGIGLHHMPFLANHSNFYLAVSLGVIGWLVSQYLKHKKLDEDVLNQEFVSIRGAICLSLFVVYFMAGIHKLNTDFFNPVVSCASDFFIRYSEEYSFDRAYIPNFLTTYSPHLVGVVEVAGALLLIVPRFQLIGVLCFVGLHSYLSPLSFFDFASLCYSILLLFLPLQVVSEPKYRDRIQKGISVLLGTMLVAAIGAIIMVDLDWMPIRQDVMQGWPFLAASFYLIYLISLNFREAGESLFSQNTVGLWSVRSKALYLLPLVLLIFTNTSYLGLRTAGNTTMFSNLRTEGGETNHLFIPSWLQIFDYQKDLVRIIEVSEEVEDWYRGQPYPGDLMTRFELKRMVQEWIAEERIVPMVIEVKGEAFSYEDITESEWADNPPNWLERKFLLFRVVQGDGKPNLCRW